MFNRLPVFDLPSDIFQVASVAGPVLAAIPELVEAVVLELPLQDILLAQRVDRTWRATIKNSPKLQKALFFRPSVEDGLFMASIARPTDACTCEKSAHAPPLSHLKAKHLDWHALSWARGDADKESESKLNVTVEVTVNPFLLKGYLDDIEGVEGGLETNNTIGDPEDSLRRMLFAQPPIKELIFYTSLPPHVVSCRDGAAGLTIGDVIEAVEGFVKSSPLSVLKSRWLFARCSVYATTGRDMLEKMSKDTKDTTSNEETNASADKNIDSTEE